MCCVSSGPGDDDHWYQIVVSARPPQPPRIAMIAIQSRHVTPPLHHATGGHNVCFLQFLPNHIILLLKRSNYIRALVDDSASLWLKQRQILRLSLILDMFDHGE